MKSLIAIQRIFCLSCTAEKEDLKSVFFWAPEFGHPKRYNLSPKRLGYVTGQKIHFHIHEKVIQAI